MHSAGPMSRFSRADKLLLCTVLPLFVIVFTLHVREAVRTGIAQAPFFAVPGGTSAVTRKSAGRA